MLIYDVKIFKAVSYPDPQIEDEYFVFEIVNLK
jgi:hypothetical protein